MIDEALQRVHQRGPEFRGWLSNHAPMAVESLAAHGHDGYVHRWLDRYENKLDDFPDRHEPVTEANWRSALGDPRRITDWSDYFARQLAERPWRAVLAEWWPRLLPGLLGGATHTVIRVGHAVRLLLAGEAAGTVTEPRLNELAHALGYWGARYLPLPAPPADAPGPVPAPDDPAAALDLVKPLGASGGFLSRLDQLPALPRWAPATDGPEQVRAALTGLVHAATRRYAVHGHGEATMLVHSATAPNAVLRTLPALPEELWRQSLEAAWSVTAGVTSLYAPDEPEAYRPPGDLTPQEVFQLALEHGDEHVIKFADTALDFGDEVSLAAALVCVRLSVPLEAG